MEATTPEAQLLARYFMDGVITGDAHQITGAYDAFLDDLKRHGCRFIGGIILSPLSNENRESA